MMNLRRPSKEILLLVVLLTTLADPIYGKRKEYNITQTFVIDALGACFDERLTRSLSPVVDATILEVFKQHFGPYNLLSSLGNKNRRLANACPADCNDSQQSKQQCVALNCVSADTGGQRRLESNNLCYFFDIEATEQAMNKALADITINCNIRLNAQITPLEDYATPQINVPTPDPTKRTPTPFVRMSHEPSAAPSNLPSLVPTQCPVVTICDVKDRSITLSPAPTRDPSQLYHSCVPTIRPTLRKKRNTALVKKCLQSMKACLCKKTHRCARRTMNQCTFSVAGKARKQERKAVFKQFIEMEAKKCQ